MKRLRMAGLVAALALTAACSSASHGTGTPPSGGHSATPTQTATAAQGPHIVYKGHRTLQLGQVAQIGSTQGAGMLIKVGKPRVSTTRLSSGYGDPPEHGYFVNFPIKILNIGDKPLIIERLDFYVDTPGLGQVNTNQGAAPYSGAPQQLDTTELAHGQGVSNYLAFDVSTPHGKFVYGPGGKTSVVWRF